MIHADEGERRPLYLDQQATTPMVCSIICRMILIFKFNIQQGIFVSLHKVWIRLISSAVHIQGISIKFWVDHWSTDWRSRWLYSTSSCSIGTWNGKSIGGSDVSRGQSLPIAIEREPVHRLKSLHIYCSVWMLLIIALYYQLLCIWSSVFCTPNTWFPKMQSWWLACTQKLL